MIDNVILHQWEISPFCGKVRKMLKRKGVRYETVEYNGLGALRAAKLSGVGTLPVLDCDGSRIQDSSDIADFLETRYPEPALYPSDPVQRAQALLLEDWADESLFWYAVYLRIMYPQVLRGAVALLCKGRPRWERIVFKFLYRRMYRVKLREQGLGRQDQAVVESRLMSLLSSLDKILGEQDWLIGSTISIADIAVSAQIDEMVRTSALAPSIREHAALIAWLTRCAA